MSRHQRVGEDRLSGSTFIAVGPENPSREKRGLFGEWSVPKADPAQGVAARIIGRKEGTSTSLRCAPRVRSSDNPGQRTACFESTTLRNRMPSLPATKSTSDPGLMPNFSRNSFGMVTCPFVVTRALMLKCKNSR